MKPTKKIHIFGNKEFNCRIIPYLSGEKRVWLTDGVDEWDVFVGNGYRYISYWYDNTRIFTMEIWD